MIRRWTAAVAVAGMVAVPAARVWCELACATPASFEAHDEARAEAPPSHCDQPASSDHPVTLGTPDECGVHDAGIVVFATIKVQRGDLSPLTVASILSASAWHPLAVSRGRSSVRQRGSTSPPVPPGTSILRV